MADGLYTKQKAALCAEHPRLEDLLDAVEWELLSTESFEKYPLVGQTPRGAVRAYRLPASPISPSVVVTFGFEDFRGEQKLLLLSVWLSEGSDDGDL